MEMNPEREPVFSPQEIDLHEGEGIEALKRSSQHPIPDRDRWLDEDIQRNILMTTVDTIIDWTRKSSISFVI